MDREENCLPKVVEKEDKHHSADFACNHCNQTDCCYWILYNSDETDFKNNEN